MTFLARVTSDLSVFGKRETCDRINTPCVASATRTAAANVFAPLARILHRCERDKNDYATNCTVLSALSSAREGARFFATASVCRLIGWNIAASLAELGRRKLGGRIATEGRQKLEIERARTRDARSSLFLSPSLFRYRRIKPCSRRIRAARIRRSHFPAVRFGVTRSDRFSGWCVE